jgi:hypothetical protein
MEKLEFIQVRILRSRLSERQATYMTLDKNEFMMEKGSLLASMPLVIDHYGGSR